MKRITSLLFAALFAVCAWAQATHNGHEYVDLGLTSGTLWATCNVGAETPVAAGGYYAWGELTAKTEFSWDNYFDTNDGGTTFMKYNTNDGILEDADDVAAQTWGGKWKIPDSNQTSELRFECYWVWTDTYGGQSTKGYIVYKTKDDADKGVVIKRDDTPSPNYNVAEDVHIFMPITGYYTSNGLGGTAEEENSYAAYWSRDIFIFDRHAVESCLHITDDNVDSSTNHRYFGQPIRPVYVPAPIAEITTAEGTTGYYDVYEFMSAFGVIQGEGTVKLLDDMTLLDDCSLQNWSADADNTLDLTLDLNGHNIKAKIDGNASIIVFLNKLTIEGDGVVENIGEGGATLAVYIGVTEINGGTYKAETAAVFVAKGYEMTINGGKFDAPNLYYEGYGKPIVKGGLFSMDPSDCVALGYEVVENDDEKTKAEYPYKVVEKALIPTAIGAVNAEKAGKTIKTIENGRVVIIKNGERFGISGQKM